MSPFAPHDRSARRMLGYTRVSSAVQVDSGLGLAAQEATIGEHCQRHGLVLVGIVQDEGLSGKDLDRPGLTSLFNRLVAGEANGIITAKLDRLSRSAMDFATLMAWCEQGSYALVAVDLNIDTTTAAGRLVATVMSAVAQWEREAISTRTLEAAAIKRGRGECMGRPGVRDTNPTLTARISAQRAAGATFQAIADQFNAEQIPTVRGGSQWRVSAVQSAAGYIRPPARPRATALPALPRRRKTIS